jgi:PAS domain-containing protein
VNTENPTPAIAQDETPPEEAVYPAKSSLLLFGPRLGDQSVWVRYGIAVASVGVIALVRLALVPLAGTQALLLPFVLSVYVAAYVAGLGPALCASVLSAIVCTALFAHIAHPIQAVAWSFHVALFIVVGFLISFVTQMLQRASSAQYAALLTAQEAQAQAKTSEVQLRLVTDHIPALVAYVDRAEEFRFTNAAFLDWFELDGAATRKRVRDVIGEDTYKLRAPHMRAALRGELVRIQGPLTHRLLGVRECEIAYVPDRAQNGKVRGFYVMVQDFTERFAAERALSEREHLLRLIYDSSSDSLYLMCVEPEERFRVITVNETFLNVTGYAREQVFGRSMEKSSRPQIMHWYARSTVKSLQPAVDSSTKTEPRCRLACVTWRSG